MSERPKIIPRESVTRRPRFALRTVKNGRAKIFGRWYVPSDQWLKYDGRLDGQRFAFGLYYVGWERELHVSLWGTEAFFRSDNEDAEWPGPECVGSSFPWEWWHPEVANDR